MSDPDIHAFQGIVTKLRTTSGSSFALDVMAEAADLIERLHLEQSRRSIMADGVDLALSRLVQRDQFSSRTLEVLDELATELRAQP